MRVSKIQQIVNTAIDLFDEYGIPIVSVASIAEHLGTSRGTVYYHFKTASPT